MESNVIKGAIKKQINRIFRNSWLDEEIFKGWLAPYSELNKAFRIACNVSIACRRTNLLRHSQTVKHIQGVCLENIDNISYCDRKKRAEIKLAAFFAEHNIAYYMADHLIPSIKDICSEPNIVQDLSLDRLKCNNIVKDVLAKRETEKLTEILKTCKFSILIDESTDITDTKFITTKNLALVVRYIDNSRMIVVDSFLTLISVSDVSAMSLYNEITNFFNRYEIPYKQNLIRFASDGANKMMGIHQSETTRIHVLYDRVCSVYKSIMECFLNGNYIKNIPINLIDFKNPRNFIESCKQINIKMGNNEMKFPKLSTFFITLHSLSHSSATVERIFSQINLCKTKIRNKLSTEILTGIMHSKNLLKPASCYDFEIEPNLIKKINNYKLTYN
ncbi:hypothetical protein ALC60_13090 [Trachymyrmex zeteki]|uniref:DUF4371 domain-containing protein n=1 Tax=Mycetomoellerius zeteki TaxID=64791 RepID=A0A151WJ77_9HYME|nr:hypothetical protein ALC60_13090 [Trachymyrmex zeteki]